MCFGGHFSVTLVRVPSCYVAMHTSGGSAQVLHHLFAQPAARTRRCVSLRSCSVPTGTATCCCARAQLFRVHCSNAYITLRRFRYHYHHRLTACLSEFKLRRFGLQCHSSNWDATMCMLRTSTGRFSTTTAFLCVSGDADSSLGLPVV